MAGDDVRDGGGRGFGGRGEGLQRHDGDVPGSIAPGGITSRDLAPATVSQALRMADVALEYLNSPAADGLETAALGEVLTALGELHGKLAAAQVTFLRRFDAADAHDADGYGSSSAWLAAKGRMTKRDAIAAVRQMRQFSQRRALHDAVAVGDLSKSWADAIARWTRKLPAEMRADTDKILLEAAAAGASLEDLQTIAGAAIERWRSTRPDPADDFDFRDRHVRMGLTFGGAGVIRGDLTPECAAALTAVLEALGKKQGPEDDRNEGQRFHDALAEACHLLLRGRLVPGRAGADTQVIVHIPINQLRQMPGAADLEDAWLRARLGEPADPGSAYLTGKDAEVAACDALTVPVVTGRADMAVIDRIIALVLASFGGSPGSVIGRPETPTTTEISPTAANPPATGAGIAAADTAPAETGAPETCAPETGSTEPDSAEPGSAEPGSAQPGSAQPGSAQPGSAEPGSAQPGSAQPGSAQPGPTSRALADRAWAIGMPAERIRADVSQALRYAIARLAVDFVSGPGGLASALRTGLLERPFSTPSLPLDIGVSGSIPGQIRRAVMLRDRHCAWPGGCDRPATATDVHHITHKSNGGETSVSNCALFCEFHHETCIHRWGWQVVLHPDGTMEASSPDGRQVLRNHAPPKRRAA
jgi:hypothetical protein